MSIGRGIFSTVADMRSKAIAANESIDALVVITLVLTKILLSFRCRDRSKHDNVLQSSPGELHVIDVCSGDLSGQRNTVCVGQYAPLGAFFFPDRWDSGQ